MKNFSENQKLNILLALGGCVIVAIILVIMFGFKVKTDYHKMKIGFIITGDIKETGWNSAHYNGIKTACDEFNLELLVRDKVKENSGLCPIAVEELVAKGSEIIFLESFNYPSEVSHIIEKYPHVFFVTISKKETAKNRTACFVRMYQGRYLAGALAGMKTKSNVLGYVAAMPNAEVTRGINAFALGAQRTNPKAKVVVMWTGDWKNEEVEKEHAKKLIVEAKADVLTYHQNEAATADVADSLGVDFIGFNDLLEGYSEHHLTSLICRWDLFYKDIFRQYFKGDLSSAKYKWIGIQDNVIELSDYSALVTYDMRMKLNSLEKELKYNDSVFSDEIYDNQGNLRCAKWESISDDELLKNINWLVKGVEVLE